MMGIKKKISNEDLDQLIEILKDRFQKNKDRHPDIEWEIIPQRLNLDNATPLYNMEVTGGEPDAIELTKEGKIIFCDCSAESPKERRSFCYDKEALKKRKQNPPLSDACSFAKKIGITILNEDEYMRLQKVGEFDNKTSSWLYTPKELRERGGAIFGDRRYGRVFVYHNGAESYYSSRGFRGKVEI